MKSFKKGIALIAVLAFLITAILPAAGLATAPTNPASSRIYGGQNQADVSDQMWLADAGDYQTGAALSNPPVPSDVATTTIQQRYAWADTYVEIRVEQPTGAGAGHWVYSKELVPVVPDDATDDTIATNGAVATAALNTLTASNPKPSEILYSSDNTQPTIRVKVPATVSTGSWLFFFVAYVDSSTSDWYWPTNMTYIVPCQASPNSIGGGVNVNGTTTSSQEFGIRIDTWKYYTADGTELTDYSADPPASSSTSWTPTAPPLDGVQFEWSWTGPDGTKGVEAGKSTSIIVAEKALGTYTFTAKPTAPMPAWIKDAASNPLTLTVTDGSTPPGPAGPQAQPSAIALGQKVTLSGTVPVSSAAATTPMYAWDILPTAAATPDLTANGNWGALSGQVQFAPADGKIENAAWPTADSWYALEYGPTSGSIQALPSPYPNVSVAQLFAVDNSAELPAKTTAVVDVVATAGTDVNLEAVWGAPASTWTKDAPAPAEVALEWTADGQVINNVDPKLTASIPVSSTQTKSFNVMLSYDGDTPAADELVAYPGNVVPYNATYKSDIDAVVPAPVPAQFNIIPNYLVTENGTPEYQIGANALLSGTSFKTSWYIGYPIISKEEARKGQVKWTVISTPDGPATEADQALLATTLNGFDQSGAADAWNTITPTKLGTYVVQAEAIPGGSKATITIVASLPATPGSIQIQPGNGTHIPATADSAFTARVVNNTGTGLTDDVPTGQWYVQTSDGQDLVADQIVLTDDTTATVTVTPSQKVINQRYKLGFRPDDPKLQGTSIEFVVDPAVPTVNITATPQTDEQGYALEATTDPTSLTGTWTIAASTGDDAPIAPAVLPTFADKTAKETTLDTTDATPGTYIVTFTTDPEALYASGSASTEIVIGEAPPAASIEVSLDGNQIMLANLQDIVDGAAMAYTPVITVPEGVTAADLTAKITVTPQGGTPLELTPAITGEGSTLKVQNIPVPLPGLDVKLSITTSSGTIAAAADTGVTPEISGQTATFAYDVQDAFAPEDFIFVDQD